MKKQFELSFPGSTFFPILYCVVALCIAFFVFSDGLSYMLLDWQREEFSHGYMIPMVSLYFLLQKLPELANAKVTHQFWGVIVVIAGLLCYFLGELSAIYAIIQYGFIIVLFGIAISLFGIKGTGIIGVPLAYLFFMIPLPNFLYFNLSSQLQLISSAIGVFILRLFDISVYLEGNVIDLGSYKLQVVDACSGLRYLFPLMSFGFVVAYIYHTVFWKKALIFLSTIPITILMNSFRITVIGITVDNWGIGAAEGFLHDFQGWVIFMACLGLLALEVLIIHRLSVGKGNPLDHIDIALPSPLFDAAFFIHIKKISMPMIITLVLLLLSLFLKFGLADRTESIPQRANFSAMPLTIGTWKGREGTFDQEVIDALKVTDYFLADYVDSRSGASVNLYIAYYNSQRKGASVHSPKTCMPGGGWELAQHTQHELNDVLTSPKTELNVNRVVIQKDKAKNLVYYWFQQRGRIVTNEYLAKWFIFVDALTRNRTDGALVRIIVDYSDTEVAEKNRVESGAEKNLEDFVKALAPLLPEYIPE
jgi:exosortase D (VPLPA-CTERM-specific)